MDADYRLNTASAYALSYTCVPHMRENKHAVIWNVSSVAAHNMTAGMIPGFSSQAALEQMIRLMATELAPEIRLNAVAPGAIETVALPAFLKTAPKFRERLEDSAALRRVGQPMDLGLAAIWLCSDASRFVTGAVADVAGAPPSCSYFLRLRRLSCVFYFVFCWALHSFRSLPYLG